MAARPLGHRSCGGAPRPRAGKFSARKICKAQLPFYQAPMATLRRLRREGPILRFGPAAIAPHKQFISGSVPPWRALFFVGNVFRGRASSSNQKKRPFPLCLGSLSTFAVGQSRKRGSLSSSLRLIRSLSTFAVETLLALRGAELRSWWGVLQLS